MDAGGGIVRVFLAGEVSPGRLAKHHECMGSTNCTHFLLKGKEVGRRMWRMFLKEVDLSTFNIL